MMECKEIMRRLEGLIPPACASAWDNVGRLVGGPWIRYWWRWMRQIRYWIRRKQWGRICCSRIIP